MEKNKKGNGLLVFLLLISLVVIVVMGAYIFNLTQGKLKQNQTAQTNNVNEELNGGNDFQELMDKLYPPKEYRDGSSVYSEDISEKEFIIETDSQGNTNVEWVWLFTYEDDICLNVKYFEHRNMEDLSVKIKGIEEEVVDVTLHTYEIEAIPSLIVLLTRNGNVYYLKDFSGECKAQKIEEISEIMKIEKRVEGIDDAFHSSNTTIAIDKDGNRIDLDEYIYPIEENKNTEDMTAVAVECQKAFEEYYDLQVELYSGGSLYVLEKLNLVSETPNPEQYETITYEFDDFYKTDIKYSDFKNAMLKYMTEELFEEKFEENFVKNENEYLLITAMGGTATYIDIEEFELSSNTDNLYVFKLSGQTRADDNDLKESIEMKVTFEKQNDNYVVANIEG